MSENRPTALVTGASRRIGRAIAEALGAAGYRVAVHFGGNETDAEAVVAALNARHGTGTAQSFGADLLDERAVADLLPRVTRGLGPVRCLVNNASLFAPDRAIDASRASFDRHMGTNLRAPFLLAQAMAQALPSALTGNIVNILDQRVLALRPEFFSYTLSKAALWAATQMLAQAFAPRIRVNGIGPGPVLASIHQTDAAFSAEVDATLLKRATPPDEIAAGVLFILSAPAMTGQMIALDAGQHLVPAPDHSGADK